MGLISFLRHDIFRLHENPYMHPEQPDRLLAIDQAIAQSNISQSLINVSPRSAQENELCGIHSPSYIERIEKAGNIARDQNKLIQLDGDTFLSPTTLEVAKLAAGAGLKAIETLAEDKFCSAFVSVRPPGHHALAGRQMGFCIFNNIALAAAYARKYLGCKRVLIIDWDVHHGNGTQDIFYKDPGVFFVSMHQYPWWPYQTGWFTEDGAGEGKGYNLNIPLPAGTGDSGYLKAWDRIVAPVSAEYKPDIILVSAGYDAHQADPMGGQKVTTTGFALLSSRLQELSTLTGAKTVCFLEGGYDTHALADSVVATLGALSNSASNSGQNPVTGDLSPDELDERLSSVIKHFSQFWKSLNL